MLLSSLDTKLRDIVRPLVGIGAVMRVAPFVNTLCLGLHYFIAHGPNVPPAQNIGLADWNRFSDLNQIGGVFVFYSTKDRADQFARVADSGSFSSVAISRYRQRFVFLRRTTAAENLVGNTGGAFGPQIFQDASQLGYTINVYSDIFAQAAELIRAALPVGTQSPKVRHIGNAWPLLRAEDEKELELFIYGAPCVAYMADAGRAFIPLEVDDRLLALSPQYETHLIWHVPELKTELHPVIRKCVADYHQQLFDAATDDKDEHFVAMAAACNDTLAARHPCFPAETFAEPRAFRKCLIDHHIAP